MAMTLATAIQCMEAFGLVQKYSPQSSCLFCYCPRCGERRMSDTLPHNAMSRSVNLYICNACGIDEALRDAFGQPLPLWKWDIITKLEGSDHA